MSDECNTPETDAAESQANIDAAAHVQEGGKAFKPDSGWSFARTLELQRNGLKEDLSRAQKHIRHLEGMEKDCYVHVTYFDGRGHCHSKEAWEALIKAADERDQLKQQLSELKKASLDMIKSVQSNGFGHMICNCDHGVDGRLPLQGELCSWHKAKGAIEKLII